MNRILNAHVHWSLLSRGLLMVPDSRPPTLYVPSGLVEKNQVVFRDVDEKSRRRLLVGRSERRQLFWHLGLNIQFSATGRFVQIRLRIVFTTDGLRTPISTERMKTARRAFCKNWWNDRWRSLMLALASWMAEGKELIVIHSGQGGQLALNAWPHQFDIPVSIEESLDAASNSVTEDVSADSLEDFDVDDEAIDETEENWEVQ